MVNHGHNGATDAQAEPKEIRRQIRDEELSSIEPTTHSSNDKGDGSKDYQPFRDLCRLDVGGRHGFFSSIFARAASGKSATLMWRLNCSARMYAAIAQRSSGSTRAAYGNITP